MPFTNLQQFVDELAKQDELIVTDIEIDPNLEVTYFAKKAIQEKVPALMFKNVKGSKIPLLINTLGSNRRIEIALGDTPEHIGDKLLKFTEAVKNMKPKDIWHNRNTALRFFKLPVKKISGKIPSQEVISFSPVLGVFPVIKCWPNDGGKFITLPIVTTVDPITKIRNSGIYRMQIFEKDVTGMHIQIQRGALEHMQKAGNILPVAVSIGLDPASIISAVAALPENIDELGFAGFLRGRKTELARAKSVDILVPANAEIVLEGNIHVNEKRLEGPFGDHFGHYSAEALYPIFKVTAITHKRSPIYPATVVGIPPMEDGFIGDATQKILSPLIKLVNHEISDLWAYYESGFHNLLVISTRQRYPKEAVRTALSVIGQGQLSLSKVTVIVDAGIEAKNIKLVSEAVSQNFQVSSDLHVLSGVALDTLDFTGLGNTIGSKIIVDATSKQVESPKQPAFINFTTLKSYSEIISYRIINGNILVVRTDSKGDELVKKLIENPNFHGLKILIAVSSDVNINDRVNLIWGIFTRFEAGRDLYLKCSRGQGIVLNYEGTLGIDATWKKGYQKPLSLPQEVEREAEKKWSLMMRK